MTFKLPSNLNHSMNLCIFQQQQLLSSYEKPNQHQEENSVTTQTSIQILERCSSKSLSSCTPSSNAKHLPKLYSLDIFQEGSDMTSSSNATSSCFYCGKQPPSAVSYLPFGVSSSSSSICDLPQNAAETKLPVRGWFVT